MYRLLSDCDSGSFDRCFPSPLISHPCYFSAGMAHLGPSTQEEERGGCDTLECVLVF